MGTLDTRIKHSVRMRCYITKGEGEVKDIATFIAQSLRYYLEFNTDTLPDTIINHITKMHDLKYTKIELMQYIWDNELTFIYPLDFKDYEVKIEEKPDKGDKAEDSPI